MNDTTKSSTSLQPSNSTPRWADPLIQVATIELTTGPELTEADIRDTTIAGSVLRLRPTLMTVSVVMPALVTILWTTGVGSDIMEPIAAPITGGMITSTIHVLIITPVIF